MSSQAGSTYLIYEQFRIFINLQCFAAALGEFVSRQCSDLQQLLGGLQITRFSAQQKDLPDLVRLAFSNGKATRSQTNAGLTLLIANIERFSLRGLSRDWHNYG